MKAAGPEQRSALASPLRLEIIGLFTGTGPLAIADMAVLMGRPAGSLYHHVGILEQAGLLERAGTRPKGRRHEALFRPVAERFEFETATGGAEAAAHAVKTMAAAFRMAERDLEAVLHSGRGRTEGSDRNLLAARIHLRASPRVLARLNKHLQAILDLLGSESLAAAEPSPGDEHLSLTLALLPLKGRQDSSPEKGHDID